jgi:hypothetical protein
MRRQQPPHVVTQIAIATRPERQVKMIGQEAKSQQAHGRTPSGLGEQLEEGSIIGLFMEDGATTIAAVEGMVAEAALGSACGAWHAS